MSRITVSLPDELANIIEKLMKENPEYRKKSHLISDAIREYLERHYPEYFEVRKVETYPTILQKLKMKCAYLRGPSLKIQGRKSVGEWTSIE